MLAYFWRKDLLASHLPFPKKCEILPDVQFVVQIVKLPCCAACRSRGGNRLTGR
jgi:hypothetical protein